LKGPTAIPRTHLVTGRGLQFMHLHACRISTMRTHFPVRLF
jgi:hypothetical protein